VLVGGVRLGVWGVVLAVCVCVGGVVLSVCVCDLLIFLPEAGVPTLVLPRMSGPRVHPVCVAVSGVLFSVGVRVCVARDGCIHPCFVSYVRITTTRRTSLESSRRIYIYVYVYIYIYMYVCAYIYRQTDI